MIRLPAPRLSGLATSRTSRTMWLISFTDLCSLMLGFFVMLYGMAEPEQARWAEIARGLSARSTATTASDRTATPSAPFNGAVIEANSRISLSYLSVLLHSQLKDRPELRAVSVERQDDRVVIGLPGELLFAGGGYVVGDAGRRVLFLLGEAVGRSGQRIEIAGHADPAAPGGWEQALARAVAVSAALRDIGYGSDLVARAFAEPHGGARGRVDIVVREQGR